MKKNLIIAFFIVLIFDLQTVSAQFPIKIPKLPKVEKTKEKSPQSSSEQNNERNQTENPSVQPSNKQSSSSASQAITRPLPTSVPVFMKDSIGIDAKTQNNNNFSRWVPQVSFDLFYDNSSKLRYLAEWFKPDGSLWFSEPLEMYDPDDYAKKVTIRSPDSDELFKASAINAVGTFGVKISNSKTNETVFQGKFKVGKLAHADEPQEKNLFRFYVEHDWLIPIGYAGYDIESWRSGKNYPAAMMWFKGNLDNKEFEAVLFHNNQKIATTDKGGSITTIQERGGFCYQIQDVCEFHLWKFSWNNFLLNDKGYFKENYPNTLFTGDLTGEFTVRIYYKGEQVREAKFSLAADGAPVRNSFSDQIFSTISLMPVKATGTAEKWNANAWKTDMFYGNPLAGFALQ
ncbi:MAG TPA: hypothetical protein VGC97_19785 [Pyrinomonadaceae bacterium]|jgi:hypothetical protein